MMSLTILAMMFPFVRLSVASLQYHMVLRVQRRSAVGPSRARVPFSHERSIVGARLALSPRALFGSDSTICFDVGARLALSPRALFGSDSTILSFGRWLERRI